MTIPYEFTAKRLQVNSEITKNVFTLFSVQKKKLKERRLKVKPEDDIREFKKYFLENEVDEVAKEEPKKDNKPLFFYKSIGNKHSKKQSVESDKNQDQDDVTSESEQDFSSTSSDSDRDIKIASRTQLVVREEDVG